jgi:hypothetical protein
LRQSIQNKNYVLNFNTFKYLVKIKRNNLKFYLQIARNYQLGTFVTSSFRTLTGGVLYYAYKSIFTFNQTNPTIKYCNRTNLKTKYKSLSSHSTIIWLGEEIHNVNCEQNLLFVEEGDLISEKFEIIPDLFSKTSGIVTIQQKNNSVQTISIKSGLVYEGRKLKNLAKKIYYPGEVIFSNIPIQKLSFCEHIVGKKTEQLLIRPVELYEFSYSNLKSINLQNTINLDSNFKLETKTIYAYKSNQILKSNKNLNLVFTHLTLKNNKILNNQVTIEFSK